jgi:hypothetical protein
MAIKPAISRPQSTPSPFGRSTNAGADRHRGAGRALETNDDPPAERDAEPIEGVVDEPEHQRARIPAPWLDEPKPQSPEPPPKPVRVPADELIYSHGTPMVPLSESGRIGPPGMAGCEPERHQCPPLRRSSRFHQRRGE